MPADYRTDPGHPLPDVTEQTLGEYPVAADAQPTKDEFPD